MIKDIDRLLEITKKEGIAETASEAVILHLLYRTSIISKPARGVSQKELRSILNDKKTEEEVQQVPHRYRRL